MVLLGSFARPHPQPDGFSADEYSDLDVMLFTPNPIAFQQDQSWIREFGEVWVKSWDTYNDEQRGFANEAMVIYEGGIKVDFFFSETTKWRERVELPTLGDVYQRGYHILVDKINMVDEMPPIPDIIAQTIPTADELHEFAHAFWFLAYRTAKDTLRGDVYRAQDRLHGLRKHCVQLIIWEYEGDSWYDGRMIHKWASAERFAQLQSLYADLSQPYLIQALQNSITLYEMLMPIICKRYEQAQPVIPPTLKSYIQAWINRVRV